MTVEVASAIRCRFENIAPISGVRNVKRSLTLTVMVFPAPAAPPVARAHEARVTPAEFLHDVETTNALSPNWLWPVVHCRTIRCSSN